MSKTLRFEPAAPKIETREQFDTRLIDAGICPDCGAPLSMFGRIPEEARPCCTECSFEDDEYY